MIIVKDPQKLKKDLISNGNTLTSIAVNIGCSKAYLSSILTGTRNPNAKVSIGICELLGKQFDTYFFIQCVHKEITE